MKSIRVPLLVSALALSAATSAFAQDGPGTYLTARGFRAPVFGVSQSIDASGTVVTECAAISTELIEASRFGRRVSRAMQEISPAAVVATEGGATFDVRYTDAEGAGFNHPADGANRRRAFEAALGQWAKVIKAAQPIRVVASMRAIDDGDNNPLTNVLALASATEFWLLDNKAVPSALAWQMLGGRYENAKDSDITVDVNDRVDWDYSLTGSGTGNRSSFFYTIMHELAHGLGFIQSLDHTTGKYVNDPYAFVYDGFVNRGNGGVNRLQDRTPADRMRDVTSNDLFFNGEHANAASIISVRPLPMIKLYAPDPFRPGSSIGHVDQELYADARTGLMTPMIGGGSDQIDPLTLAIMKDLGYTLVEQVPPATSTPTRKQ